MPKLLGFLLVAAAVAVAVDARGAESRLRPIPDGEAKSTHGPYHTGACETCHQRHDPKDPGPAVKVTNELCYDCHDEFRGTAPVKMDRALHPKNISACTSCHNPHNARKPKLRL